MKGKIGGRGEEGEGKEGEEEKERREEEANGKKIKREQRKMPMWICKHAEKRTKATKKVALRK